MKLVSFLSNRIRFPVIEFMMLMDIDDREVSQFHQLGHLSFLSQEMEVMQLPVLRCLRVFLVISINSSFTGHLVFKSAEIKKFADESQSTF